MAYDSLVGKTLAETYSVVRLIGKGGMGAIYEAHHTRLAGKRYAIKILSPQFAENPELLARFRREAEIASPLGHENIVEVHDFNLAEGQAYMVMELLDGEDLAGRIRSRGPMPIDGVKRVVDQVASALDAAHRAHIVHRDLKPPNIFLCRRGGRDDYVKVLDFGVSKVLDSASVVTRDHALVGTPYYMSPEQAEGRISEIDSRTDVFALGAIACEMLTGKMAFGAPTFSVALYKVCFVDPPEVHLLRPDVPPALSMVLRRALSKERFSRTQSVLELAGELTAAALHGVMPAGVPPPAPDGTGSVAGVALPRVEPGPLAGSVTAPAPTPSYAGAPPAYARPPPSAPSYGQPSPSSPGLKALGTPAPVDYAGSVPWAATPAALPGPPPWNVPGTYGQGTQAQAPGAPQGLAAGSVYAGPPPSRKGLTLALVFGGAIILGTGIWLAVARSGGPEPSSSPAASAAAPTETKPPEPTPVKPTEAERPPPVPHGSARRVCCKSPRR